MKVTDRIRLCPVCLGVISTWQQVCKKPDCQDGVNMPEVWKTFMENGESHVTGRVIIK
jgi:hypothetical protein